MKILVTVKRVTDYEAKIRIAASGNAIETEGVNMVTNPFDEIAVEEALRLKDKTSAEVVVVSVGGADASQQLRNAMAMGADRGILVRADGPLDCAAIARVLAKVVESEKPDILMMGKQAVDDDSHQVSERLAERLGWGQATHANTVSVAGNVATVVREADGGLETVSVTLPCVITTDLRLNTPRYATLPGIMKAKKKPLDEKTIAELGVDVSPFVVVKKLEFPPKKAGGEIVADVATLISKLHNEAKVI
jgi:electron transfer flavoprotein beta subunit